MLARILGYRAFDPEKVLSLKSREGEAKIQASGTR